MDPILAALPLSLLKLVEGSLSNDEVSSDEEMLGYFIDNGLTETVTVTIPVPEGADSVFARLTVTAP
jgi:hypothetical protein